MQIDTHIHHHHPITPSQHISIQTIRTYLNQESSRELVDTRILRQHSDKWYHCHSILISTYASNHEAIPLGLSYHSASHAQDSQVHKPYLTREDDTVR